MNLRPEAFFLDLGERGRRFCIHLAPSGEPRRSIVYIHPFAEEMNKSRRMASLGAQALAQQGNAVLQIDLAGCGDSSGDFGEATWDAWVEDTIAAAHWLLGRSAASLWFWGLRAGALVATEASKRLSKRAHLLLWQPAIAGKTTLQQFLRLRIATQVGSADPAPMKALLAEIEAGQSIEIAGYLMGARLAAPLALAKLSPPNQAGQVIWLETSTRVDAQLLPASTEIIERWRLSGHAIDARVVAGPAFWQTAEIETAPALIEASIEALDRSEQARAHRP